MLTSGPDPATAPLVVVLLHGRGGSARDIMGLARHLGRDDAALLAPEAEGGSWWPRSFLAPLEENEPQLGRALAAVERIASAVEPERLAVVGFSQGGCLAIEHAARAARPIRVAALSGALIGTAEAGGEPDPAIYGARPKRLDYPPCPGLRAYLGCHEADPHIPLARLRRTEAVMRQNGAEVTVDVLPGQGHGIVAEEIERLRALLA